MRSKLIAGFFILTIISAAACATTGTNPTKKISEDAIDLFDIKGEILWEGPKTIVYPLATASYQGVCGKRKGVQQVRVAKARTWHNRLLDVAIWLEPVWEDMAPEEIEKLKYSRTGIHPETVQIEEKMCEFVPKLTVAPVGSTIEIVNRDRKDHWLVVQGEHNKRRQYIQIYGEPPPEFTLHTPNIHFVPEGSPVTIPVGKSDKLNLKSGFHMWMEGWVFVTDKIWHSKVNDKGFFEISNVPRGVYRVNSWHPQLGYNSTVVKVPDDIRKLVLIGYKKGPGELEEITDPYITTHGEVRDEKNIWQEIEEW